jgi:hypothetical protein
MIKASESGHCLGEQFSFDALVLPQLYGFRGGIEKGWAYWGLKR